MNKRILAGVAAVTLLVAGIATVVRAQAQQGERWLHVRVDDTGDKGEQVRVNLPLSVAEAVLPAVKARKLENGRIRLSEMRIHDVDVRAVLEAVRNGADGEYVTVETKRKPSEAGSKDGRTENVRVAKKAGYLLLEVRETRNGAEDTRVDVKMPLTLVDALLSGPKDELDLVAAIRALRAMGDTELVTVKERNQTVRIWVDSKNTSE